MCKDKYIIKVETKENKIKIIIIFTITLLLITIFSILGMYYAKLYKSKLIAQKKEEFYQQKNVYANQLQNEDLLKVEEENNIVSNVKDKEDTNKILIPKYSENAKKEMMNIYKSSEKIAYLTFDDGPSQAVTPLIIDLLKEENIKATFFVLGSNVKNNPDILKRAYLEGHYIANHGYSHNYAKLYSNAQNVLSEYNKAEKEIQKAIGNTKYSSHLFRFPGGYYGGRYAKVKQEAGKILNKNDISYIDWNVLTGDAEGANTKEKILSNVKKYSKDKGTIVVLMHDASSKILTYETLKDVINYLKSEGYTFENFYKIMS